MGLGPGCLQLLPYFGECGSRLAGCVGLGAGCLRLLPYSGSGAYCGICLIAISQVVVQFSFFDPKYTISTYFKVFYLLTLVRIAYEYNCKIL